MVTSTVKKEYNKLMVIILTMLFCLIYVTTYYTYTTTSNAISIKENGVISLLHTRKEVDSIKRTGNPIIEYEHDSCLFVAVVDQYANFVSITMLNDVTDYTGLIGYNDDWASLLATNEKGVIELSGDGIRASIHYEWVTFESGTRYVVLYGADHTVATLHTALTYAHMVAVLLSFILIITLTQSKYKIVSSMYNTLNTEMRKHISG